MAAGDVQATIDEFNSTYDELHKRFEDNFWATKMNLKGNSTEELTRTKNEYEQFLRDRERLGVVRELLEAKASNGMTAVQEKVLRTMERTFLCYLMETEEAAALKEQTVALEGVLEAKRNAMNLGYTDPSTSEFVKASSVLLATKMSTSDDEAVRKACYDACRTIGPYIVEEFCEIAKLRNKTSKANGYADYYEYKIQTMEGFDKKRLFEILDELEEKTRPFLEAARAALKEEKGEGALQPWNTAYALSGDHIKEADPYYPFEDAVSAWARSFAALGIDYKKSEINLDLCDRENKYSNGFCHWPQCPYVKKDGSLQPCITNFTSLATPSAIGSGVTGLKTLMHEGGHAAAFANIEQPSPFFSQERPPMSVAYAENQSMFLDSLIQDAGWLGRYAVAKDGSRMPWELIEKGMRKNHAYRVFRIRQLLKVSYFEKALYESKDEDITPEKVLALSDAVDVKLTGGPAARPCIAVPHILADESSCYCQGYVLAELSVHQTRKHFLKKYGSIVDNPQIGADLTSVYWKPGNSENFLDLVEKMTSEPLTSNAYVDYLNEGLETRIEVQRKQYDEAVKVGPKYPPGSDDVLPILNMRMRLVHGDAQIADSEVDGFNNALAKYKLWLSETFPAKK